MQHAILTSKGKDTGEKITLSKEVFGIKPNEHVVYLDVKRILAHQRQGTAKTKDKGEITASTRKIMRQKGSGRARKGSVKSGILRGGGNFFGPKPRKYKLKVNKKTRKLARRSVLSLKASNKNLLVLQDFTLKAAKTKAYQDILQALKLIKEKTLLILPKEDHKLIKAAKNLPKARVTTAEKINTYDLLNADKLLVFQSSVPVIEKNS
ncbi:MAG: 50S ribosomal protein L4 [Bacteroidota bacterium]